MRSYRIWQPWELEVLRVQYPVMLTATVAAILERDLAGVYQKAAKLGLRKSAEFFATPAAGRTNGRRGFGTRFQKGHVPANKGLRRPGWSAGRMRETQFKPGVRQGVAVRLYKPIGTERISRDGYLERKVNDDLPLQRRWKAVHRIIWEEANGPIPKGYCIAFRDGNKRNVAIENLELRSLAENMRRNTVHNLPKPVAHAVQLLGALKRQINRRTRA